MKIEKLYKYVGKNGTVITPVDLGIPCEEMKRLIADEDKELAKGDSRCSCIDVYSNEVESWKETDLIPENEIGTEVKTDER